VFLGLQGPGTVREKQEKERNELRDLVTSIPLLELVSYFCYVLPTKLYLMFSSQVGKNLHVLGQIEGVDLEMYKETVLPRVLEQVRQLIFASITMSFLIGFQFMYNLLNLKTLNRSSTVKISWLSII